MMLFPTNDQMRHGLELYLRATPEERAALDRALTEYADRLATAASEPSPLLDLLPDHR